MNKHKLTLHEETAFLLTQIIIAFFVAMTAAANFGVSMIVAPAYILSLKIPFLSFGQAEAVIQGFLFVLMCVIIRRFRISYLFSFATCLIYGVFLDLWRWIIPAFNPANMAALGMPLRVAFFVGGTIGVPLGVAMGFKIYPPPQVYDYFVKMIVQEKRLSETRFKTCFDMTFLLLSVAMTLLMFGGIRGIGVGTLITTAINGTIIGFLSEKLDEYCTFVPLFPAIKEKCMK